MKQWSKKLKQRFTNYRGQLELNVSILSELADVIEISSHFSGCYFFSASMTMLTMSTNYENNESWHQSVKPWWCLKTALCMNIELCKRSRNAQKQRLVHLWYKSDIFVKKKLTICQKCATKTTSLGTHREAQYCALSRLTCACKVLSTVLCTLSK